VTIWAPQGTASQVELVQQAVDRMTFPFDVLLPGLRAAVGRDTIPVDWADLSQWAGASAAASDHDHGDHDQPDPLEARGRVLGLAWYSGRVSLDVSLESDPELAVEVFASEGAHMVDFFWMTDAHRRAVWNALHSSAEDLPADAHVTDATDLGHGHGWFDVGGYRSWVGEAWMGLFVRAYSDAPVTIPFDHPPTDAAVAEVRAALTPYFASSTGTVHDQHRRIRPVRYLAAVPAGAATCRVCRPA
jgi:hypothetical protein